MQLIEVPIKEKRPDIRIIGVEPVKELRDVALAKGLQNNEIVDGDATKLSYNDKEFDLVCEFGVLHHIKKPERAVAEMLRVSNNAIFISDSNNFGQGSNISRSMKQFINLLGLWKIADFIKTKWTHLSRQFFIEFKMVSAPLQRIGAAPLLLLKNSACH